MQRQTNDAKSRSERRQFLKSAGGAAAGFCLAGAEPLAGAEQAGAAAKKETLALHGGPKAVTTPLPPFTRWPRFGEEEEKEIVTYLRDPDYFFGTYGPIVEFEKAWSEFTGSPYCKTYSSGTGSLTAMLFALDLPPGSEILVADDTTWWPVVPMRFFGLVPVWAGTTETNRQETSSFSGACKRSRQFEYTLLLSLRCLMVHWVFNNPGKTQQASEDESAAFPGKKSSKTGFTIFSRR